MKKRRIAVIGLGQFGATMAQEAQINGMEVLAMDINEDKVNEIADHVSEAIIADSTNAKAIAAVDWNQFMTVIVAIGSDIKNSMMTVIHLQEAGVPDLWCKVKDKYRASLRRRCQPDTRNNPVKKVLFHFYFFKRGIERYLQFDTSSLVALAYVASNLCGEKTWVLSYGSSWAHWWDGSPA